jgi:hypothetical protein
MTNVLSELHLNGWHFGKYFDNDLPLAFLIIKFNSLGEPADTPLKLPFSERGSPKTVMKKLLDAGADIEPKLHMPALEKRLAELDVENGLYLHKVGHCDDLFVVPPKVYGTMVRAVIVDSRIAAICNREFGTKGSRQAWNKLVAKPAEGSSYAMLGIATGLSAPIYGAIISDEGVVFNLAGKSGLGKTTVAMIAKSVSGQSTKLFSWNTTNRGLTEALAAASDTLFVIDDWEKLDLTTSWSRMLRNTTHLITGGNSKSYAEMVKEKLPDLSWSCPVLTSGPCTVEKRALEDKYVRTNGDRRRMIDIPIEPNGGKGIWDNLQGDEDTGDLSDAIRLAAKKNYGHLFEQWIELMMADKEVFIDQIEDIFDAYVKDNKLHGDTGFEQTVTKKFAIVYAAGMQAIRSKLLPWDPSNFQRAIVKLHHLARGAITTDEQAVRSAFIAVNDITSDEKMFPYVKKSTEARFKDAERITGFIIDHKSARHLYITLPTLEKIVGGKRSADLFQNKLKEVGAHVAGPKRKACVQMPVTVAGRPFRPRLLKIELDAFDAEVDMQGGCTEP